MDISTLLGLVGGFGLIIVSILMGGELGLFINIPSLTVVIGGTIAALLVRFSIPETIRTLGLIKMSLFFSLKTKEEVIQQFGELAQIARKEGLLALERIELDDPYMAKGIAFCVDGAETRQIEAILTKDIQYMKARHDAGQEILRAVNTSAPAFGMIGTLIGLVQMLANMEDPASIGPAMAVAILTTLYGAVVSNLIATPIADKLMYRSAEEVDLKMLMMEGILGLKKGENPRMLEELLHTYVPPATREGLRSAA
ncbi:MAG: motility protein A [Bradymonadia bacterium]